MYAVARDFHFKSAVVGNPTTPRGAPRQLENYCRKLDAVKVRFAVVSPLRCLFPSGDRESESEGSPGLGSAAARSASPCVAGGLNRTDSHSSEESTRFYCVNALLIKASGSGTYRACQFLATEYINRGRAS